MIRPDASPQPRLLPPPESGRTAILVSGGLDSAILLGESLSAYRDVFPLYVRHGYIWEKDERAYLQRYLDAVRTPALHPLVVLDIPLGDLLPEHWSMTGRGVPDGRSPDAAVCLPSRNLLLLAKALLWCDLHGVTSIALATLKSNPFSDATPAFFDSFSQAVDQTLGTHVAIRRPYSHLHKVDVMRRGRGFPLDRTFSCLRPMDGLHCGVCNKCAERHAAFSEADMSDPTVYRSSL